MRTPSGQSSAVCGALLVSSGHVLWARYATHKKAQHKLGFFVCGAPDTIRTCDPLVRSQVLYPAELRVHYGVISLAIKSMQGLISPKQAII